MERAEENFFCPFLPTENSRTFPQKERKKVRKTPLVEMTGGLRKEGEFPTQIPVKQGEKEYGRGKVEQIVNKKMIKIQPLKSDAGSKDAGWGNFSVLYA